MALLTFLRFAGAKNLLEWQRESGQQLRLFKPVPRSGAVHFRFELAGKVTIGQPRVGIEKPNGLRSVGLSCELGVIVPQAPALNDLVERGSKLVN